MLLNKIKWIYLNYFNGIVMLPSASLHFSVGTMHYLTLFTTLLREFFSLRSYTFGNFKYQYFIDLDQKPSCSYYKRAFGRHQAVLLPRTILVIFSELVFYIPKNSWWMHTLMISKGLLTMWILICVVIFESIIGWKISLNVAIWPGSKFTVPECFMLRNSKIQKNIR